METIIKVITKDEQVIHNINNELCDIKYFNKTINQNELNDFIENLETSFSLKLTLYKFLLENELFAGIRHCDTYETKNYWRIQLQINFRIYPRSIQLLEHFKNYQIFYTPKDLLVLTFNINKNE